MKKFINKVQELQKKAAHIQQTIETAPAHAARLREAVTMTAGELHQLRSDVQSDLSGLRTNSEEKLVQAMQEINNNSTTLDQAGYELTGMDLDLAVVQRLAVHLHRHSQSHPSMIRALISKETNSTLKSILSGILQAEILVDKVSLSDLAYEGVTVHVGPAPAVRLCWILPDQHDSAPTLASTVSSQATPIDSNQMGTLFEQRPMAKQVSPIAHVDPPKEMPLSPAASESPTPTPASSSPWGSSALDRFKKMPDFSKYGAKK